MALTRCGGSVTVVMSLSVDAPMSDWVAAVFADSTVPVAAIGTLGLVVVSAISAYGAIMVARLAREARTTKETVTRIEIQTDSRLTKLLAAVGVLDDHIDTDPGSDPLSSDDRAQVDDAVGTGHLEPEAGKVPG